MATPFLEVRDLHGWYGESHVLHGVNFDVAEGPYEQVSRNPAVIEAYMGSANTELQGAH